MVTTGQQPLTDTQKINTKESKHNAKQRHQMTREKNRRRKRERTTAQSENNKMTVIVYLINTHFNLNGLNATIKRHRAAERIKEKPNLSTGHRQVTYFISKDTHRYTQSSNTHIKQTM